MPSPDRQSVIESMERFVLQPSCGCCVRWNWRYDSESDILPAAVDVTPVDSCERHAGDDRWAMTLAQAYKQLLTDQRDILRAARRVPDG